MKEKIKYLWVLVIIAAVLPPIVYFFLRILGWPVNVIVQFSQQLSQNQKNFLDGAVGNWFATIVGLIGGVPVGLWIDHIRQEAHDKLQIQNEVRRKEVRKNKILHLIRNELISNRDMLEDLLSKQEIEPQIAYVTGMRDMLWSALSDGGELQWIDDLDLLDKLANAYYHIRALIFLEKRYFDPYFNTSVSTRTGNSYAGALVVRSVKDIRPGVLEVMKQTIKALDAHLEGINEIE